MYINVIKPNNYNELNFHSYIQFVKRSLAKEEKFV